MNALQRLLDRFLRQPEGVLVGAFACLIVIGMGLLSLPLARTDGLSHPFEAAFTATSAVCVTGLVVVDTGEAFTRFGQVVILGLIELGGLGIMTFAAMMVQLTGRRLSLSSQGVLHDVFFQKSAADAVRNNLKWIVSLTFAIEAIGVLLLWFSLPTDFKTDNRLFFCVFHSVSAFCNAGFSTCNDSLTTLSGGLAFMTSISLLIVLGGLGYTVTIELLTRIRHRQLHRETTLALSLHTRTVLVMSLALIVIGASFVLIDSVQHSHDSWSSQVGHAVFQSITARTAGFNSIDTGRLTTPVLLWVSALMLVGGSPGSCAGGVKTTTLAIWLARLKARLFQHDDVTIGGRRIPTDLVRRAALLLGVSMLFNAFGIWVLSITEVSSPMSTHALRLEQLVFEQISAFATVGLSTGITPSLSIAGKCWIMLTMFVGRLGPLTIMLVMIESKRENVRLPEERIMIG